MWIKRKKWELAATRRFRVKDAIRRGTLKRREERNGKTQP